MSPFLASGGSSLGTAQAPKLWLGPKIFPASKFSRTLDTLWSTESQKKISKFDATRCQILRLKCTKFYFRWGSAPDPAGGAYNAPQDPRALAVFKGSTCKGRERARMGRERERKRGEGRELEGSGPQYFGLKSPLLLALCLWSWRDDWKKAGVENAGWWYCGMNTSSNYCRVLYECIAMLIWRFRLF